MATLNTSCGWVAGDPARVLLAAGLPLGTYSVDQVTVCMNELCTIAPTQVTEVRGLLDDWDAAQAAIKETNVSQDGRVLIKADVLEWQVVDAGINSPQAEVMRIRDLLYLYFGYCPMFVNGNVGGGGVSSLIRS